MVDCPTPARWLPASPMIDTPFPLLAALMGCCGLKWSMGTYHTIEVSLQLLLYQDQLAIRAHGSHGILLCHLLTGVLQHRERLIAAMIDLDVVRDIQHHHLM